jgi:hypothetical protein
LFFFGGTGSSQPVMVMAASVGIKSTSDGEWRAH